MTDLPVIEHPEIPDGMYCYKGWYKDGEGKMRQDGICQYWEHTDKGARCNFIKEEHTEYCPYHLVWDQVKECDINNERDYVPETREERAERCIKEGYKLITETCPCGKEMQVWYKGKGNGK